MHDHMIRWAASWRLWLALAALAVIIAPVLALVAAITIIGIPITIIMMLIPGLAFVLLPAAFLKDRISRLMSEPMAWVIALGAVLVASAAAAAVVNAGLDRKVAALRAGEIAAIGEAPVRRVALVSRLGRSSKEEFNCHSACLRLLLTGAVEEVLLVSGDDPFDVDDARQAVAARFERGGVCRALRLTDEDIRIDGEMSRASEFARRRIAAGDCLVERDARLGEADAVIAVGSPDRGQSAYAAGLNPVADTVRAYRLSFWRRDKGRLREEYRRTGVIVLRHPPVLFPTIVAGYGFEAKVGFARLEKRIGFDSRYEEEPDLAAFLEKKLRLAIRLGPGAAPDLRDMVDALIARRGAPLSATELQIADDFLGSLYLGSSRTMTREDAERATRFLERLDYETPFSGPGAARAVSAAHADLAARIAAALFQRLFAVDPAQRESRYNDLYIPRIATAIKVLPDETLRSHRGDLERLAADPARRAQAAAALARLSVFGADAENSAIDLVAAALDDRDRAPDDDRWRDLFRAGLSVLCEVHSAKGAAALRARIGAEPALAKWPHGELLIGVLANGGMTDAEILSLISTDDDSDDDRADLARRIRWARKRPSCAY